MIELRGVSLSLGGQIIFEDADFRAGFQERIAVLGKSGSGKTTLLKLILGLIPPDKGDIYIDGQRINGLKESEMVGPRMNFSIVFQHGALFDSMNVLENVAFCMRERSNLSDDEIERRAVQLLRSLDIEGARYLMPEDLSGGMQRRVAIARAWADCQPKMMLYDEPTTALDPATANQILALVDDIADKRDSGNIGFIMVTHEVGHAAKVSRRFLFLKDGKFKFDGPLDALKASNDPELREFVAEISQGE